MASPTITGSSEPRLSSRGEELFQHAGGKPINMSEPLANDRFDPVTNPDGLVSLVGAQNTLMQSELSAYFMKNFTLSGVDLTFGDHNLSGSVRLNTALARFFNTYFHAHIDVLPSQIVPGVGCSAIIDQLAFHLADEGDAVLVAAPYFGGFSHDMGVRNRVKTIPVWVDANDRFGPASVDAFEIALQKAKADGTTLRAVILCNPNNPIGQCYPRETIIAYARFCQTHDLHLICDEIYGLSTFSTDDVPNPVPFISVLSLDLEKEAGCAPGRVHVIYGMSKDFNANGLRMGALVTRNAQLITSLRSTAVFMKVSSASDVLWSAILNDEQYLPKFLAENRKRLREAYTFFTAWLKFHKIPYLPSNAGHYLMADLRQFFPTHDADGKLLPTDDGAVREQELLKLLVRHKVQLGNSAYYTLPESGWSRVVWAMRRDHFVVGLRRMEEALGLPRWGGLEVDGLADKLEKTNV